jgi:hypothetical protein
LSFVETNLNLSHEKAVDLKPKQVDSACSIRAACIIRDLVVADHVFGARQSRNFNVEVGADIEESFAAFTSQGFDRNRFCVVEK